MMTNDLINKTFLNSLETPNIYDPNNPNDSKQFLNYFNSVKLYSSILLLFILILIITAFYFLCLYFKSLITRKDSKIRIRVLKDRSKDRNQDLEQSPESINQQQLTKIPPKEPNLQPTTENNTELDEYRSIIASKLKPPPSTLDGLISDPSSKDNSIDVEIKQERDNDDVFSVISTKSLERYKTNKQSKNNDRNKIDQDKNKFDLASETTDSEPDKIILLTSGTSKNKLNLKINDKKPIKKY